MKKATPFQQTEYGVFPEEWQLLPLSVLLDFCNGVNADKKAYGRGTPFINVLEVIQNVFLSEPMIPGKISLSPELNLTYRVVEGDILFNRTSETQEEIALSSVYLGKQPVVFGGFIIRGRPISKRVNPTYLAYALRSFAARKQFIAFGQGAIRANIGQNDLKKAYVALPPTNEQEAIVEVLRDVDVLLDALERLITKKRDIKQAAMRELLTEKVRLPGFSGEWREKALSEVASIYKGIQLHKNDLSLEGLFPHFNGGITPSGYTDKFNHPAQTIIISEGGNSCGYVQLVSSPFWCGGHCYSIIPYNIDNKFLFQCLKYRQNSIMTLRVGSGLPNIQKSSLSEFRLFLPNSLDEQSAIANALDEMDVEIATLNIRAKKTRALKQAMMQELLTGKTRLVKPEARHAGKTAS